MVGEGSALLIRELRGWSFIASFPWPSKSMNFHVHKGHSADFFRMDKWELLDAEEALLDVVGCDISIDCLML